MPRRDAMAAVAMLLAGTASAQTKPELLFQAEAQTLTGTCTGQPVRLEGNHNMVTLSGACGSLLLKGVGNTVQMGIVPAGPIHVEGSGNRVHYAVRGAPPAIVALGPDNDVAADGVVTVPPKPAAPPPPAPLPPVQRSPAPVAAVPVPLVAATAPQTQAQMGPLALAGDDQHRVEMCAGRDVTILGNRSAYDLRGGCKSLTLRGDLLTIQAEITPGAKISVTGRGSIVTWQQKGRGHGPASIVRGEGSRVQRVEPLATLLEPAARPATDATHAADSLPKARESVVGTPRK